MEQGNFPLRWILNCIVCEGAILDALPLDDLFNESLKHIHVLIMYEMRIRIYAQILMTCL